MLARQINQTVETKGMTRCVDNGQTMKILLADDHAMVRVGLRLFLQRVFEGADVFECGDYAEAISICEKQPHLDMILFDRCMPGLTQTDSLRNFLTAAALVPAVMMSASEDPAHIWGALDAGARGYIPKTSSEDVMTQALKLVLSGGTYLPPNLLASRRSAAVATHVSATKLSVPSALEFTQRQREVLKLLVYGQSNKQIADRLNISQATVHTHVNAIFKALNVRNRTTAARRAAELGLIAASESP